ncbi:MAG: glycosyltransferase [Candidatus Schekmanbacteria bacterium]|nr:MAG: glycosyltransferase [Candidatus Schekmanbacteria bacterium]
MKISVVIPVKNSLQTLPECISAVKNSDYDDYEIVVVDDLSEDGSADYAREQGCRVVKSHPPHGVSAARNTGAIESRGEIIFFIDSDIIIEKDTLSKLSEIYETLSPDAVVGVQSEKLRFDNFLSQFKNLWMRFTYLNQPQYVALFYTSVASIRKDIFLEIGGFDENYNIPNVEDTDLGQKLYKAGYRIYLARELEVEHIKSYDFASIMKTDYYRARGLVKMVLRRGLKGLSEGNKTSVPSIYMLQMPAFFIAFLLLLAFIVSGNSIFLLWIIPCLILMVIANSTFLIFLGDKKSLLFVIISFFFIIIDNVSVLWGMITGWFSFFLTDNKYY